MPVRYKGGGGSSGVAAVHIGPDYGTEADLVEAGQLTLASQSQTMQLAAAEQASHAEKLTMPLSAAEAISHAELQTMAMLTRRGDITLLQYTTSQIVASKDSWCDAIAVCASDVNHNGTDLSIDGVVATKKDAMVGWDLSAFPTGATVTAATFTWNVKTASIIGNLIGNLIAEADEGWSETTVKCSNIPFPSAAGAFTNGATNVAGEQSIALLAVALTRIGLRMGVGSFSMRLAKALPTQDQVVLESKDQGTNNAAGPRLAIVWTMPS